MRPAPVFPALVGAQHLSAAAEQSKERGVSDMDTRNFMDLFFDIMRTSSYVINVVRAARSLVRWVRRWRKRQPIIESV